MPRQYSQQKCQALRDYQRNTSTPRALAVCVLTPLPALIYTLAVDALLPLAPIEDGWDATPNLAFRFFVGGSVISFCTMNLSRRALPEFRVAPRRFVMPALVTGAFYCGLSLTIAELWVFPVPFMTALTSGGFTILCGLSIYIFIGPQPFRNVPDFHRKLTAYITQVVLLNFVNFVYVSYGAFYQTQQGVTKAIALCLPIAIKVLAKTLTRRIIQKFVSDDFLPEIIQFSVELLHSMFVTTCVQTSSDPVNVTLILFVFDFLPLLPVYREIRRLATSRDIRQLTVGSSLRILPLANPMPSQPSAAHLQIPTKQSSVSTARKDAALRRALYACENHLLIEYIECIIPSVYTIYVGVLFFLPNARYYEAMHNIATMGQLTRFLVSVSVLVLLQIASVVGFSMVLSRRVLPSVSSLHQLSFVLEKQQFMIQCWLWAWIPFCILSSVQHGGMDFTLRFQWMQNGP